MQEDRIYAEAGHVSDTAISQALGHPERIRILRALIATSGQSLTLNELADQTAIAKASLPRRLHLLHVIGALTVHEEHGDTRYALGETALARALTGMLDTTGASHTSVQEAPPTERENHLSAFDLVLNQMPSGVAIYNREGNLIRMNTVGERISTRAAQPDESAPERLHEYVMRTLDGAPLTEPDSPSGRARRGETFTNLEYLIDGQHGSDTYLQTSGAPLLDANGEITGAVVIFHDVTEQYRLKRDREEQRQLNEAIVEWAPVGIALYDVSDEFRCLRHNTAFLQLTGPNYRAQKTIVGVPLDDLFDADSRARVRAIYEQVRASGEPFTIQEFPAVLAPDPAVRWYRWSLTPLFDAQGAMYALLNSAIEITELVQARERAHMNEAALRAAIVAMPEAVAIADPSGNFLLTNETAETLWGQRTPGGLHTQAYADVFPCYTPDGRMLESEELPLPRALAGDTVIGQELIYLRPDKSSVDLLCNAAPIFDESNGALLGGVIVFQDITQLKALERQRDEFLNIAAHELRTPLTTIQGTLQVMMRQVASDGQKDPNVPALARGLDRMQRQVRRISALVEDLLDTTRIQSGQLTPTLAPCDLSALVSDVVEGQMIGRPNREIMLTLPTEPLEATVDATRITQVVDNLLSNALKYSPDDQPVMISLDREGKMAHVSVTDRGLGIPQEGQEHLFERFYRVPGIAVESGSGVGLGLGLFISRGIVERHGGRIWLESPAAGGSTFHVLLPLDTARPLQSLEVNPHDTLFGERA